MSASPHLEMGVYPGARPRQATLHRFSDSLARSRAFVNAPWWEETYRAGIPGFQSMAYVHENGWGQRAGIDRVVTLRSGKTVTVDEKVRQRAWPDILLERWTDRERHVPGWIQRNLGCDYIAYSFIESRTCHLLPFLPLRAAWLRHGREWIDRYPPVFARNVGFVSESVPVPIPVVMAAINEAMQIQWGST